MAVLIKQKRRNRDPVAAFFLSLARPAVTAGCATCPSTLLSHIRPMVVGWDHIEENHVNEQPEMQRMWRLSLRLQESDASKPS
ncbi:MAG: hypothetical protein NTU53_12945 [Planctomycetota bacterium]|nr:hypothetical protein [Planctomycetota bacterium]